MKLWYTILWLVFLLWAAYLVAGLLQNEWESTPGGFGLPENNFVKEYLQNVPADADAK